jgi:hypothetical protein
MISIVYTRSRDLLLSEAARVLCEIRPHVWDGQSLPVPIEEIADSHLGLLVTESGDIAAEHPELDADGQRISGALIPERAEILLDRGEAARWPRRRRYTIAHEIGHWELHRGGEDAFCRSGEIAPVETLTGRTKMHEPTVTAEGGDRDIEWEANVFAGALLMPPWLVRKVWDRERSVEALAETFDVSLSAVSPRWMELYSHGGNGGPPR